VDSEKTKKNIEQSVLASFINQKMEQRNTVYFCNNFKHRILYQVFVRGQQSGEITFRSAKDFEASYKEIMKAEQSINKYNADYKAKLEKEMQKFNGKILVPEGAETNSEMTNATRQTKKSRQSGVRFGSPGVDDLDEAATLGRPMDATLNDRDDQLEAGESFMQQADDDHDLEGEKEGEKKQETPLKEFFRDPADG
jgi:hypothetical protein